MTQLSHTVHDALATAAERHHLARVADAAADETGAITAEYGARVSSDPLDRIDT